MVNNNNNNRYRCLPNSNHDNVAEEDNDDIGDNDDEYHHHHHELPDSKLSNDPFINNVDDDNSNNRGEQRRRRQSERPPESNHSNRSGQTISNNDNSSSSIDNNRYHHSHNMYGMKLRSNKIIGTTKNSATTTVIISDESNNVEHLKNQQSNEESESNSFSKTIINSTINDGMITIDDNLSCDNDGNDDGDGKVNEEIPKSSSSKNSFECLENNPCKRKEQQTTTQEYSNQNKRRRLRRPIWDSTTNSSNHQHEQQQQSSNDFYVNHSEQQQQQIIDENIDHHHHQRITTSPMNICQSSNDSDSGCMSSSCYGESIQSPSTPPPLPSLSSQQLSTMESLNSDNDDGGTLSSSQQQQQQRQRTPPSTYDPNGFGVIEDQPEQNVNECREQDDEPNKIFVGGLPWDTTEYDLEYYFSHFGKVTEINIKYDPMSCLTRGFCFVTFQSEDIVRQILRKPVHIIKGKIIELKRAKYRPICKKIFVGGLDPLITEQDIRTYFSQYGTVIAIESPKDKIRNRKREFCFIVFDSEMAVDRACFYPRQFIINRICDVKKAQPQPICYQQKRMAASAGLDQTLSTAHLTKILLNDNGRVAAASNQADNITTTNATNSLSNQLNPVLATPLGGTILYFQPFHSARIQQQASATSNSFNSQFRPITTTTTNNRLPQTPTTTTMPFNIPYGQNHSSGLYSPLYASITSPHIAYPQHPGLIATGTAVANGSHANHSPSTNSLIDPNNIADYYLNYYAQTAAFYAQQQQQHQNNIESFATRLPANPSTTMAFISSSSSSSSSSSLSSNTSSTIAESTIINESNTKSSSSTSNNIQHYKSCFHHTNPIIGKPLSSTLPYSTNPIMLAASFPTRIASYPPPPPPPHPLIFDGTTNPSNNLSIIDQN
uniref:RRM domain-containing protein n=1 Tax=Dermatophagoides pteronyssinus TaxID=6956 RepID=A0A6P6XMT2_DERPT|nr:putative uncharacterized protein DDB_G0277255 [Dermatophagoides pteronyssinus]